MVPSLLDGFVPLALISCMIKEGGHDSRPKKDGSWLISTYLLMGHDQHVITKTSPTIFSLVSKGLVTTHKLRILTGHSSFQNKNWVTPHFQISKKCPPNDPQPPLSPYLWPIPKWSMKCIAEMRVFSIISDKFNHEASWGHNSIELITFIFPSYAPGA